ncbi:unnamed protein product [Calypogeia fissa]
MAIDKPVGNKKVKKLAVIERKVANNKNALAESTNPIALALNGRAKAMELVFEIQLFSLDLGSLGYKAQQSMPLKGDFAEQELQKQFQNQAYCVPSTQVYQENIDPNQGNVNGKDFAASS